MASKKQNSDGKSSPEGKLAKAILSDDFDSIESIISNTSDDKRKALLGAGLCTSCKSRNVESARRLLSLGADANHLATRRHDNNPGEKRLPPLLIAVPKGNLDMVQLLLHHGAEVDIRNEFGRTALMQALDPDTVKLLHSHGANLEAQDSEGSTALMVALMECRSPEVWQALLECGADIRAVDYKGRTVLMTAAWKSNVDAMQVLLSRGIDLNKKDNRGRSILHHLAIDSQLADGACLEQHKRKHGCIGSFRKEVIEPSFNASVDGKAQGESQRTCLHCAAITRKSQLADMMLKTGKVIVDARERRGRSALHFAAARNNIQILKVLLDHDADPNLLADGAWSPLHVACNVNSTSAEAIRMLVGKGADPNRMTSKQQTALHIAAQAGYGLAVEYLIQLPAIRSCTRGVLRESLSLCASNLTQNCSNVLKHFAPWSSSLPDLPHEKKTAAEHCNATIVQFGRSWRTNYNIRNCSVYDLLYKADPDDQERPAIQLLPITTKEKTADDTKNSSQGASNRFKWIHLPANNVSWCTDLIQKCFIEGGATDPQSFKDWERSFDHQRQGRQLHSRFMDPVCQCVMQPQKAQRSVESDPGPFLRGERRDTSDRLVARPLSPELPRNPASEYFSDHIEIHSVPPIVSTREQDRHSDPAPEEMKEIGSMYLFLPYLHFETFKDREDMQDAAERGATSSKESHSVARLKSCSSHGSEVTEPGELLFRGYLKDLDGSLHMRRTLDQFMYHNIDTRHRDRDQVMQRYQTKSGIPRDEHKMLMVDQLWMWILSDDLIVTAFPQQWRPDQPGSSDVHARIIQHVRASKNDPVNNVFELAMIISSHCLGAYDLRSGLNDECQFLHMFDAWIGENMQKETNLFHSFIDDSKEVSEWLRDPRKFRELQDLQKRRRSKSRWRPAFSQNKDKTDEEQSSFLDNLMDVSHETALLKEIMDIRDELNMLALLFRQQAKLLPTMRFLMRTIFRQFRISSAGQQRMARIFEDHKRIVHHPQDDIRRMQEQVDQTYRSIRDLLDLKQQHANAIEARYAREQTEGTSRQGKTLTVFTVVTVIFLPLSFIAAFFTIEIAEFPHIDGGQEMSLAFVSTYLFGIGIPLAIICVCIAMKTEYIADQFRNFFEWIFGRDPGHAAGQLLPAAYDLSSHAVLLATPNADGTSILKGLRSKAKQMRDVERGDAGK